ncbi:hypothetical protein METEAL_37860 [Mesoterricola silvestris]|uniref:Uncharacterized protein n=1 Tax=Mesoterricola silvestris TaxID=2927979 RepID=A0AA48GV43_9BACT|nr:hypothetical protein METEAL_37860 [Mesoterricola silvestris]
MGLWVCFAMALSVPVGADAVLKLARAQTC